MKVNLFTILNGMYFNHCMLQYFNTVITGTLLHLVIMVLHFIKVCGLVYGEIRNQGETLEGIQ